MSSHESLLALLDRWRSGDQSAAAEIYRRYEQRLLRLADQKIGPRLRQRVEPEDIMLSVLDSLLGRIAKGQYTVDPSGSLWRLIGKIADNKIRKRWEYHTRQMRDVRKEEPMEVPSDSDGLPPTIAGGEPAPEDAVILADELESIRRRLKPDQFEIFELLLQGYSHPEIAKRLGCARQTVRYKAMRIAELLRCWSDDQANA